jgi:hypothetical protein
MKCIWIAVVLGLTPGLAPQAMAKPLKVFILAGQSNMQGHANVSTFDSMADDPSVKEDEKPGSQKYFRQAQIAPTLLPEFKGNVVAVHTAPYWDDDLEALRTRLEALWPKVDAMAAAEMKKKPKMTGSEFEAFKIKAQAEHFTPDEWKRLQAGVSNGGYHYLGAAKIMAPIGKAFAEALANLKKDQRKDQP